MTNTQPTPERFYSLDVLRGIAALAVVFWHYQHFFFVGENFPPNYSALRLPLYGIFFLFYELGSLAVNLFFSLSGFIFYWLYSVQIQRRALSAKEFFILRFSRLYPLHFLTLLWVAFGQMSYHNLTGSYFIFPRNDVYHFVLNLFLASSWGFQKGSSFNGPIWSVSVEVVMYSLFFVFCRVLPIHPAILLAFSIFGIYITDNGYSFIGQGISSFFIGGCVYLIYKWLVDSSRSKKMSKVLAGIAATLWALTVWAIKIHNYVFFFPNYAITVLFPLTILALALIETEKGSLAKRFAILGDISYSSYLLHFPLQLTIVIVFSMLGQDHQIFYSVSALVLFFALVFGMALASYHYFERPAQSYLRKKWLKR